MHWVYGRVASSTDKEELPGVARRLVDVLLRDVTPSANLGSLCNNAVGSVFASPSRAADCYEELKRQSNEYAGALLPRARAYIDAGKTAREKLERSCFLAAASNVAPLNSPSGAYTFQEITQIIDRDDFAPVVAGDVYQAVMASRRILYITDNAGEIGFDSLVIDLIGRMGPRVTLVVKKKTFFEDATLEDARFFGLDKGVDRIVTADGFFAPRAIPGDLREVFAESDLIIAKGTGSYEALSGETGGKPSIFMLKVKCGPIARKTGIDEGNVVIKLDQGENGMRVEA
jgi:uncharacterized protein with ATP-grasp and redox domains